MMAANDTVLEFPAAARRASGTMSGTKRIQLPTTTTAKVATIGTASESDANRYASASACAQPPTKKYGAAANDGEAIADDAATAAAATCAAGTPSLPPSGATTTTTTSSRTAPSSCPSSSSSPTSPSSAKQAENDGDGDDNDAGNHNDDRTSKDYYFDSYSHHGIHEEMLKDEVRTRTYQMAILGNRHLFEGKVVLDVGCGTGILSMFAVQAGASHVYAVDCSSIISVASTIVRDNGMSDRITLVRGRMEDVVLPVTSVDVIVSEWMGYFLLYESMLNTVLLARDRWLGPGGVVFPDKAVMYLCACEDEAMKYERIDFWDDVYGFDMRALKDVALREPVVDVVDPKLVVTNSVPILNIDLQRCTEDDLSFSSPFRLRAQREDRVHSLVAYFECAFTQGARHPLGFSTSPFSKYTHWKQTIFYLDETISVCEGEEVTGTIACRPNRRNARDLDINLDVNFDGSRSKIVNKHVEYRLR